MISAGCRSSSQSAVGAGPQDALGGAGGQEGDEPDPDEHHHDRGKASEGAAQAAPHVVREPIRRGPAEARPAARTHLGAEGEEAATCRPESGMAFVFLTEPRRGIAAARREDEDDSTRLDSLVYNPCGWVEGTRPAGPR